MRPDALGPYIVWVDYGYDGWGPYSFDTLREAVAEQKSGDVITKIVKFEIKEIEAHGDQSEGKEDSDGRAEAA